MSGTDSVRRSVRIGEGAIVDTYASTALEARCPVPVVVVAVVVGTVSDTRAHGIFRVKSGFSSSDPSLFSSASAFSPSASSLGAAEYEMEDFLSACEWPVPRFSGVSP